MSLPTLATRILEELQRSSRPLDDDELARRLGVSPRQTINQACRRLALTGRLRRYIGPEGKIVNDSKHAASPEPMNQSEQSSMGVEQPGRVQLQPDSHRTTPSAGNSQEQRLAEGVMLKILSERMGVTLAPRAILLADGIRAEVDGASDDLSILVEAWAHQGPPKSAQKHKVLADTLKLLYVASTLNVSPRLMLCLSDPLASYHFTAARSWAAMALRDFGVEVIVVDLPEDIRTAVLAAQKRQFR